MWNSKIDNFVHFEINSITCLQVGVKITDDAIIQVTNEKELPDYPFQFSPKSNLNPFQRSWKQLVVQYFNVRCAAQYVTCFLFTD